jgi:hypothetical protein
VSGGGHRWFKESTGKERHVTGDNNDNNNNNNINNNNNKPLIPFDVLMALPAVALLCKSRSQQWVKWPGVWFHYGTTPLHRSAAVQVAACYRHNAQNIQYLRFFSHNNNGYAGVAHFIGIRKSTYSLHTAQSFLRS